MPVDGAVTRLGVLLARRYRLAGRIASGGMGTVHRAWDERLDRMVAVKLLHPHLAEDDEVRARFAAEARHAAKVRHANVVAVLDHDVHDDQPFIVLELVDGRSLRAILDARAPLSPPEVARLLTSTCAGLSAVHRAGLVHRDVKPENLLLDAAGDVRVADFGISRALDSTRLTPAGTLLGSVEYMAPEVVLGREATFASDQYMLGVVTFEALTGRTPLPAEVPLAAALRHTREAVPPPSSLRPELHPQLDAAVLTATRREPTERHPTLDAYVAAVHAAVAAGDDARPADGAPGRRSVTDLLPGPGAVTRRSPRPQADRARVGDASHGVPAAAAVAPHATARPAPSAGAGAAVAPPPASAASATARRPAGVDVDATSRRRARGRVSLLALAALATTVLQIGAIAAPLLGFVALRRIDRSYGRLRGEAIALLAVLLGLLRIAARLVA
jgi:hypothetical protein